jgi:hypothetical protein
MRCRIPVASAAIVVIALCGSTANSQTFSIDDNPTWPLTGYIGFGFGAEDPYGMGLPPIPAGKCGPSPSLLHPVTGPFIDGEPLRPLVPGGPPVLDCMPPNGVYLDALSADHERMSPQWVMFPRLEFSVDRWTDGMPGMPLNSEWIFNQQPGDVWMAIPRMHPGLFIGTLGGGPFAGFLPTAFMPGPHKMWYDESHFGLTAGLGAGVTVPSGIMAPPIIVGSHDNIDGYNEFPFQTLDVTGDLINDVDYFFSIAPDEAFLAGIGAADILDVAAGAGGTAPIPYAPAPTMGLDTFGGPGSDDIDALILWDNNIPLGPAWGGPGGEPAIDYAIFSLSNGSASLMFLQGMGIPADGSTVFFTDFTGAFAVYSWGMDLGIVDIQIGDPSSNIDALEMYDCYADYNQDLQINTLDVLTFLNDWVPKLPRADCNWDGVVNTLDVLCFLNAWNAGCPY